MREAPPGSVLAYVDMWAGDLVHERKLAGIRRYAEMRGWIVRPLGNGESRPSRLKNSLRRIRPIGCIVESSHGHRDLPPRLFRGIPTVYLDCPPNLYDGKMPRVVHDGTATVREAFRELASNHPAAYAVVGHSVPYFWSRKRVRDFRTFAGATGLPCLAFTWTGRASGADRADALATWLSKLPRKSALFAINDEVSVEVAGALRRIGRRIPVDMTLVGVDNRERMCESSSPMLSSVQVDFECAGYRAARLLDELMRTGVARQEAFGPLMTVRRESTRGFGRCEPRILSAIDLIRREACNGLRARDVANLFRGSRRLVDLRFRETFGHSILDEIQNVRFERVCFLLAQTDKTIASIADLCGFGSEVTLREQFRHRMGMSMTAWRLRNVRK